MEFNYLLGSTLTNIKVIEDEEIIFTTNTDRQYKLFHIQDCCESVVIEDICGDLNDLLDTPLTLVAEEINTGDLDTLGGDCNTWTFYKMGTVKGTVTIRWHGNSNGYYSERVSFTEVK